MKHGVPWNHTPSTFNIQPQPKSCRARHLAGCVLPMQRYCTTMGPETQLLWETCHASTGGDSLHRPPRGDVFVQLGSVAAAVAAATIATTAAAVATTATCGDKGRKGHHSQQPLSNRLQAASTDHKNKYLTRPQ